VFERAIVSQPYEAPRKIGRNEKVTISSATLKETKTIKWKKAQPLLDSGEWEMTPAQ
jgi:hypothetical protein